MTTGLTEKDIRDGFAELRLTRPIAHVLAGAHKRRVRRRLALGAVPALGLIAAGGAALLRVDQVWPGNVYCYDSADPKTLPFGASSPRTTGAAPEKLCAEEWRQGFLPGEIEELPKGGPPYPVPALKACVADGASIGVFPTSDEDFCSEGPVARRMRLAEIPDGYEEHVEEFVALSADAARRVRAAAVQTGGSDAEACLDETSTREVVERVLADRGLDDWTIRFMHSKEDAPCWTHVNFDSTSREVDVFSTQPGVENIWINDGAVFPQDD